MRNKTKKVPAKFWEVVYSAFFVQAFAFTSKQCLSLP